MRYTVYRRSPYPWENQFAATEPMAMVGPVFTTNDLNSAVFAATLWANWLGDLAAIFDSTTPKVWLRIITPGTPLAGVQISATPFSFPPDR